jgi:hypothetical protein
VIAAYIVHLPQARCLDNLQQNISLQNKYTNYKGIKNNNSFGQITGIQEKLNTTINRMPRNRLPRVMKHYCPTGRRNYGRPLRDFWICETGTGQQVAQLHDIYDDDDENISHMKGYTSLGRSICDNVTLTLGTS